MNSNQSLGRIIKRIFILYDSHHTPSLQPTINGVGKYILNVHVQHADALLNGDAMCLTQ